MIFGFSASDLSLISLQNADNKIVVDQCNELITRDGGVGARNAGAAGIETRSTVGRKPADKNFKKRPVSFVTGYTDWEGVVEAIIAAADNNRTGERRVSGWSGSSL